jgi:GNAT superfamily N-acetyltransferase
MDDIEIRLLSGDDWRLWRGIRLRALADSPDSFGSTYAREAAYDEAGWRESLSPGPRIVALAGDRVVAIGGGWPEGEQLDVIAMWTDPAWRGRRLAARILDALIEWAAPHGLGLELAVTVGNDAARRAYEEFGFTATGETRPLRDGSHLSLERMVLSRG